MTAVQDLLNQSGFRFRQKHVDAIAGRVLLMAICVIIHAGGDVGAAPASRDGDAEQVLAQHRAVRRHRPLDRAAHLAEISLWASSAFLMARCRICRQRSTSAL